jgi:type I restriction enzyme S subunit
VEATVNQACFAVLPNETFDSDYLHFWLRYSYETIRTKSEARGGNQSNLNGEMLKAFEVPLISRSKQEALVRKVKSSLSEAIQLQTALEKKLDEVEQLPSHLLRQAFAES